MVQKLARDRGFQVTADQLKFGNFLDKMTVMLPAGKYTLETAVMDRESRQNRDAARGIHRAARANGVGISSLRRCDPIRPTRRVSTPTTHSSFRAAALPRPTDMTSRKRRTRAPPVLHRYQDPSISAQPAVEIEFCRTAKCLTKVPMQLPAADAQGSIPYLMTIRRPRSLRGIIRYAPWPNRPAPRQSPPRSSNSCSNGRYARSLTGAPFC